MTVGQLIDKLKQFDPNVRAILDGYEGGVDDVISLKLVLIKLNVNKEWCYGKHKYLENTEDQSVGVPAVHIR